jgi:hypothetical protein
VDRRTAIKQILSAPLLAGSVVSRPDYAAGGGTTTRLSLATFAADVTPPLGSPLCGGWIPPVRAVDDPLQARGVVLLGSEQPIVLCALDWVECHGSAHDAWRAALAKAAGTSPNRVAVQCIHQHNAPLANLEANTLAQDADAGLQIIDAHFFHEAVRRAATALKASLEKAQAVTHIGTGQGRVDKVASSRRVLGPDGRVAIVRYSACKDPKGRDAPEGTIDPFLKTLSFWRDDRPLAALHYYATHPMSYYGDGRVSSDFCGLARDLRQREQPDVFQVYFTGCAGDITAGKYNDGSPAMRNVLRDRIHAGMAAAWEAARREPAQAAEWSVAEVTFPRRTEAAFLAETQRRVLADRRASVVDRSSAAIQLAWLSRADRPIELSCLRLGRPSVLHLPGEPFVRYQLFAQELRPTEFVCVAGYSDGGMGYIPLRESYAQGGYEPKWSFVAPESEVVLTKAIKALLAAR